MSAATQNSELVVFTDRELAGQVLFNILAYGPSVPSELNKIVDGVFDFLSKHHEAYDMQPSSMDDGTTIYSCKNITVLHNFIYNLCHLVPEIVVLNLSEAEIEAGLTVDDVETGSRAAIRRALKEKLGIDKNNLDYLSLGALSCNVTNYFLKEYESKGKFEKTLAEKHPEV